MKMILRIVSVLVRIAEMVVALELVAKKTMTNIYEVAVYAAAIIPMLIGCRVDRTKTEQKPLLP